MAAACQDEKVWIMLIEDLHETVTLRRCLESLIELNEVNYSAKSSEICSEEVCARRARWRLSFGMCEKNESAGTIWWKSALMMDWIRQFPEILGRWSGNKIGNFLCNSNILKTAKVNSILNLKHFKHPALCRIWLTGASIGDRSNVSYCPVRKADRLQALHRKNSPI